MCSPSRSPLPPPSPPAPSRSSHYNILSHIYRIQNDVNDNPTCRTEKNTSLLIKSVFLFKANNLQTISLPFAIQSDKPLVLFDSYKFIMFSFAVAFSSTIVYFFCLPLLLFLLFSLLCGNQILLLLVHINLLLFLVSLCLLVLQELYCKFAIYQSSQS